MKKIIACVHYYTMVDDMNQMIRSFKYFHPDIPMIIIDHTWTKNIYNLYGAGYPYAPTIKPLLEEYDMLIHFDADCIITSRCEELLEGDFDVACTKNNNYLNMAGAVNPGYTYGNIPIDKYLNIGTFALNGDKGKQFLKEWMEVNTSPIAPNVHLFENGTFNIVFHGGNYKTKILDEDSNPYYYGVSSAWGYGEGNHWQSWKQIRLENDQLYLRHKLIRILHKAGASSPDHRFNFETLFSPEVVSWIKKITA